MNKARSILLVPLVILLACTGFGSAEANLRSTALMSPNQGYCRDGRQHADIGRCPENRPHGVTQRKRRGNYWFWHPQ